MSRVIFRENYDLGEEDVDGATTILLNNLARLSHPNYDFMLNRRVAYDKNGKRFASFWVRVIKRGTHDSVTGKSTDVHARGHALLAVSSNPEVLAHSIYEQICLLEQHEVAEFFTYRRKPIFNPHIAPDAGWNFVSNLTLDEGRQVYKEKE